VFLGGAGVTLALVAVLTPAICGYEVTYVDTLNGRLKTERVSLVPVRRVRIQDTEYTELLRECGFIEEGAEWKPAYRRELGLCMLRRQQRVHYEYGAVLAYLRQLGLTIRAIELGMAEKCQVVRQVKHMLSTQSAAEVRQYLFTLVYKLLAQGEPSSRKENVSE